MGRYLGEGVPHPTLGVPLWAKRYGLARVMHWTLPDVDALDMSEFYRLQGYLDGFGKGQAAKARRGRR